jgi:EAL domain-containing protein (putative c-di-GMP-specific phosphodiesterase class I)
VIEQAISDHTLNSAQSSMQLAINVSNRQLFSRTFVPYLLSMFDKFNISPNNLKLEITESIALDTQRAKNTLKQISALGCTLSLDDFGTGYSSLSRLHELRADELKIDISFVRRIKSKEGRIMLQSIIDMGHAMNLSLVAEGVEDEETAILLTEMGVEKLQGYYFSRPMSRQECQRFMRDYASRNANRSDASRLSLH